jgi:hypothetical protein
MGWRLSRSPAAGEALPRRRGPGQSVAAAPLAALAHGLRVIERKRSMFADGNGHPTPRDQLIRQTIASFRLDGIDLSDSLVAESFAHRVGHRQMRSAQARRIRNHVAILRRIELALRRGQALKSPAVLGWYASVGCGLCTTSPDDSALGRLELLVRRINSPQLRLDPAVREMCDLHARMLADPIFPGFNGIMARLLLRFHLGRCKLPPVLFRPDDVAVMGDWNKLLTRMVQLIDQALDQKPVY